MVATRIDPDRERRQISRDKERRRLGAPLDGREPDLPERRAQAGLLAELRADLDQAGAAQPDGFDITFGEMPAEAKHGWDGTGEGLSHRARAFAKFARARLRA